MLCKHAGKVYLEDFRIADNKIEKWNLLLSKSIIVLVVLCILMSLRDCQNWSLRTTRASIHDEDWSTQTATTRKESVQKLMRRFVKQTLHYWRVLLNFAEILTFQYQIVADTVTNTKNVLNMCFGVLTKEHKTNRLVHFLSFLECYKKDSSLKSYCDWW